MFFLAMTLGPRPYYWPNTKEISFGNSPPLATRAGYMALACMPFLFILGAKANPISAVTGISHEKLNVWHNWVAWAMFALALVHTFPFIIFHMWKGDIVEQWNDGGMWVTGVIALLAQAWLTFMSIRWIRERYYEFFKATHILAAAVFFIFFFIHCDFRLTSWDYFIATAVLYALCFFYTQFKTYMEHGVNHARLSLITPHCLKVIIETNASWTPGQHVYLRFMACGLHALTAHPFTICSVPQHGKRNQMIFYIQPKGGVTARLAKIAEKSPDIAIPVLLDGPYGGVTNRWFGGFDRTLVLAGGSGAGFSLPMIESFLESKMEKRAGSELQVVVATRDPGFREWYSRALDDITERHHESGKEKTSTVSAHLYETVSSATNTSTSLDPEYSSHQDEKGVPGRLDSVSAGGLIDFQCFSGRPDIVSIAQRITEGSGSAGMVVCGPSSMTFDLGKAAAVAQEHILGGKAGASEVWFHKESFS
ncbi:hypothetical protein EsH8_VIII_000183 [Colletotrichum jinshuiense]